MSEHRRCEACEHPFSGDTLFCPKCGKANLIGQIAGSYRLTKRLGAGGMGVVYLAEHTKLGTPFAIKVLHREVVSNQQALQRFLQEAKATSRLRHEHVIFLADYGEIPNVSPYIAMEYLEGSSLSDVLEETLILPINRVFLIVLQLCEAMMYAHAQGIVHRDLKPDNLFLLKRHGNPTDFLKVLDFGIAKLLEHDETALTKTGALLGTPHYVSPEQVLGKGVDEATDIFATGVILFQMLTGKFPYDGHSLMEILSARLLVPAPLLGDLCPMWKGSGMEALVAEALRMNKAERLPSMQVFFERLLAIKEETLLLEKADNTENRSSLSTNSPQTKQPSGHSPQAKQPSGHLALEDTAFSGQGRASSETLFPEAAPSKHRVVWLGGSVVAMLIVLLVAGWWRNGPSVPPPRVPAQKVAVKQAPKDQGDVDKQAQKRPSVRQDHPPQPSLLPRHTSKAEKQAEPSAQEDAPPSKTKQPISESERVKKEVMAKFQESWAQATGTRGNKARKHPKKRSQTRRPQEHQVAQPPVSPEPLEKRLMPSIARRMMGPCGAFASEGEAGRWVFFRVKPARVRIEVEGGGRLREEKAGRYCLYLPNKKNVQITISPEDDTLAKCVFEHTHTQRFPMLIRLKDADDARGPSDCLRSE